MVTPAIYLPPTGRVRLLLPYGPNWRWWLREVCGQRTRPEFERRPKPVWTVSRPYFLKVMHGLASKYGEAAVVTEHNQVHHCTAACQAAKSSPDMCECVCAGAEHGFEQPDWVNVTGDLLVKRNVYRRRFICRWDVELNDCIYEEAPAA